MGNESESERGFLVDVETVHTVQGSFTIYQVSARAVEDIENLVASAQEQGIPLVSPTVIGRIGEPFFKHKRIVVEGKENMNKIVYLVGPATKGLRRPSSS